MTAQPSTEEILARIRERIAQRGGAVQGRRQRQSISAANLDQFTDGMADLSELRQQVVDAYARHATVGQLNPRNPGLINDLAQFAKKAMRRSLSWYTRPIQLFQGAVLRSLDQIVLVFNRQQSLINQLSQESRKERERRHALEGALERKLRAETQTSSVQHENQGNPLRADVSEELSSFRSATERDLRELRDALDTTLAEIRDRLSSIETHSKETRREDPDASGR